MTGSPQQQLHATSPIVFDFDERFQLAQMMGVAQRMLHVRYRVIRLPMIMHDDARYAGPSHCAKISSAVDKRRALGDNFVSKPLDGSP